MHLKKLESSEHGTTSDESDDVVSSGSGEMYDPSSSDESSDSNLSPSSPITSTTNNAETQPDETQLHEPSPTVRGKKRTRNVENWCKVKAKLLRNSGKSYTGRTGKTVPPRKMGPSCKDKCILSCSKKFTEQYRVQLFTDYWAMGSIQRQRDFLSACIEKLALKYRRITAQEPRKPNCAFYLRDTNTNKVRVCKTFIINTLGISERAIRTVIGATFSGTGIASLEDKRGKHTNRKKIDEEILISVRNHINSIPRVESHYVRKDTKREIIDGGLTIADMHRQYSAERSAINMANYDTYARIFNNEFNIGFFLPKKDQCDQCEAYKNAVNDDKKELEDAYHLHQEEKELSRLEKAADKEKSQKGEIKLAVYDLQAVLPVPMGQTSAIYYKSRLNCFNFTVTEIGSDKTVCFFWHEGLGHRCVNEIGTGVYKYLDACSSSSPGQDVVLYSDNCGGQQKNRHKDLNVIEYARDNHIHMLSTPPHTTHKLQPLDRVFFKLFKQAYGAAIASWMRQNYGARLTDYDVAGLTNMAFTKPARLEIAQSGFRCTGIQHFNRDVFSDLDFLGSAMTDIPIEDRASQSTIQATTPVAFENSPRPY
ncbi:unnamed protein product [Danaus chrysippus]|uniref:(African queen) hypothetical protein n=1 Tax=Danaus chrysippus TaxID=151541 RepID=A0A8J2QZ44_9NEOP|nr:unnamed protein product [Danaus chrysippus]